MRKSTAEKIKLFKSWFHYSYLPSYVYIDKVDGCLPKIDDIDKPIVDIIDLNVILLLLQLPHNHRAALLFNVWVADSNEKRVKVTLSMLNYTVLAKIKMFEKSERRDLRAVATISVSLACELLRIEEKEHHPNKWKNQGLARYLYPEYVGLNDEQAMRHALGMSLNEIFIARVSTWTDVPNKIIATYLRHPMSDVSNMRDWIGFDIWYVSFYLKLPIIGEDKIDLAHVGNGVYSYQLLNWLKAILDAGRWGELTRQRTRVVFGQRVTYRYMDALVLVRRHHVCDIIRPDTPIRKVFEQIYQENQSEFIKMSLTDTTVRQEYPPFLDKEFLDRSGVKHLCTMADYAMEAMEMGHCIFNWSFHIASWRNGETDDFYAFHIQNKDGVSTVLIRVIKYELIVKLGKRFPTDCVVVDHRGFMDSPPSEEHLRLVKYFLDNSSRAMWLYREVVHAMDRMFRTGKILSTKLGRVKELLVDHNEELKVQSRDGFMLEDVEVSIEVEDVTDGFITNETLTYSHWMPSYSTHPRLQLTRKADPDIVHPPTPFVIDIRTIRNNIDGLSWSCDLNIFATERAPNIPKDTPDE